MGVLIGADALLEWIVSVGLTIVPVLRWVIGFAILGGVDYMFLRRIRGRTWRWATRGFNRVHQSLAGLVKLC